MMDEVLENEHQALIDQRNEAHVQVRRAAFDLASTPWSGQYQIPEKFAQLQTAIDHLVRISEEEKSRNTFNRSTRGRGGEGSPGARRMNRKTRRTRRNQHLVNLREQADRVEGLADQMAAVLREMAASVEGLDDLDQGAGALMWKGLSSGAIAKEAMESFPAWISQKLSAFGCPALLTGPTTRWAEAFPKPIEKDLLRTADCPWVTKYGKERLKCRTCGDVMPTAWLARSPEERREWFLNRHEDCRPVVEDEKA